MTTWEIVTKSDILAIEHLITKLRRAGRDVPRLPRDVTEDTLASLTKKEAGVLMTALRETLNDTDG